MPQYETERPPRPGEAAAQPAVLRATSADDAVRRTFGLGPDARVEVAPPSKADGWADVAVDGAPAGRVRPHARMRFRRD